MKVFKRIMMLTLVLAMLASVMVIPASALNWESQFTQFQLCSRTATPYNSNYVRALQRFLQAFRHTSYMITDNGGVDGSFGAGTESAVKTYQFYAFGGDNNEIDGVVGMGTWEKIADDLDGPTSGDPIVLTHYNSYQSVDYEVITIDRSTSVNKYKYHTTNGSLGNTFHWA